MLYTSSAACDPSLDHDCDLTGRAPGEEGAKQMAAGKASPTTIDEYIRTFPADVQPLLERVRQTIRQAAPGATEAISYGIPTFDLNGKHLVHFAGWKHHLSVYPLPAGDAAFQTRIAPYKRVKSTVQFPLDQPIPVDVIGDLVTFLQREKPESKG
jgi:uncharacterized protein YdhG (YjbR/CyaY superfamily)